MPSISPPLVDEGSLIRFILERGLTSPDSPALTSGDRTLTSGGLRRQVLAAAGAISAACGGKPGRIGLLGTNSTDLVVAYLAGIAAGGCAVPLPASAHPSALRGMVEDCEPSLIFADKGALHLLDGMPGQTVIGLDFATDNIVPLNDFIGSAPPLDDAPQADPADDFNIIYSSGTTGRPKGIVHSHSMRYRQTARSLFGIDGSSVMLLATPLYSNTTLMPLLAALFHGGYAVLMPKFDAEAYLDLAETLRGTHTMLVPVQYQRILAAESFARRDLGSFKVKQSTGAPIAATVKQELVTRWPGRFLEVYGLTEGGCTCILDAGAHPEKAHTVGRPSAGNDIRIIDENGKSVPTGTRGEIIGRSPMMMSRYFRNEAATEAFRFTDAEGTVFHRTGDIGFFDEDGFLVLVDRKKDMIISGGFNIYASDLEETLLAHPDVLEAAVIAVPSEKWGETPLGLVVPKPGAAPDPAGLLEWANGRLGKMQRLSAIELRDGLPLSPVGKVLKQQLREPYWGDRT
ncbi:class I adenylate-forming enzyme family protein [Rhizobium terrae]|uniref:class I adenylate-forming enzyme family protein n=1 Tax=Rhizobium terrae TaxID=2171756 RepID=UPI0013C2B36A|nr:AMP-binding protein [Rhizobium terrae]